jgi:hypothetical protein
MGSSNQFAVLQKELDSPMADQLKRAFKTFSHLTDADAVHLSASARGILMRQIGYDAAHAFQLALQAEGVGAVVVAESDLPRLPEGRLLQRLEFSPEAFTFYDLLGRPTAIAWHQIALVAAAAVRHFEMSTFQTERTTLQFSLVGGFGSKKVQETGHKVESDSLLLLEIILAGGVTRFQVDAAQFPFKYVIDQPELSKTEKFIWLIREVCRRSPQAILNGGARSLHAGQDIVPACPNRQVLADEMVWLLWHVKSAGPP